LEGFGTMEGLFAFTLLNNGLNKAGI